MNIVILLAAGKSLRAGQNKLWVQADPKGSLNNRRPLWAISYETFLTSPLIGRIIVVVPKGDELRFLPFVDSEKTTIVTGGETRMESFKRGLTAVNFSSTDVIIDHNAANPNVTSREISEVIEAAKKTGAAGVSLPAVDTILQADNGVYSAKIERRNLRLMQTPQAVRGDILQSLELPETTDLTSALVQKTTVKVVEASPLNRKITFAEDLEFLCAKTTCTQTINDSALYYLGEDSHQFSNTGQLILGGLAIPELPALKANSDGDVILHAIGRALAGAAGQNFSEIADPLSLSGNQNSSDYVQVLLENISVLNISISLEGARPKIDPIAPDIKASLGRILKVKNEQIHISANSGEGLTSFGRGEGIRCLALLTISKK